MPYQSCTWRYFLWEVERTQARHLAPTNFWWKVIQEGSQVSSLDILKTQKGIELGYQKKSKLVISRNFRFVDDFQTKDKDIDVSPKAKSENLYKETMPESKNGIEIQQNKVSISMCQSSYIREALTKFGLTRRNSTKTPLPTGLKLKPNRNQSPKKTIGTLMYITVATRPDIAHAVNMSSQFTCFGKTHWETAKRTLIT